VFVSRPGLHWFSLWIRESGLRIDKIVLSADAAYVPADLGPPESDEADLAGANAFVRGDVNADAALNVSDAVSLLRFLCAGGAVACEDRADVNDDGTVNVADAVYLLMYEFSGGPPPPPPFPKRGYDKTPDKYPCGDAPGAK
jgi:hypothetical protein